MVVVMQSGCELMLTRRYAIDFCRFAYLLLSLTVVAHAPTNTPRMAAADLPQDFVSPRP